MKPVGYLLNTKEGLVGEPGMFYDYILASNGLYVRASGPLLEATIEVTKATVRGLAPVQEGMQLKHGKIPRHFYDLMVSTFIANPHCEIMIVVVWQDGYHLKVPPQESGEGWVKYQRLPNTVLEFHSHGIMPGFFSTTDSQDEQGLCIFGVAGKCDRLIPDTKIRVGLYGYFKPVELSEVFE